MRQVLFLGYPWDLPSENPQMEVPQFYVGDREHRKGRCLKRPNSRLYLSATIPQRPMQQASESPS